MPVPHTSLGNCFYSEIDIVPILKVEYTSADLLTGGAMFLQKIPICYYILLLSSVDNYLSYGNCTLNPERGGGIIRRILKFGHIPSQYLQNSVKLSQNWSL